jgi:transcriptional regulator with XRE-family HTH domain
MTVCQQLKRLRGSLNLSQDRFGMRLGISGKSISAYETGRCIPNMKVLSRISNEYNVDFPEMSNDTRECINQRIEEMQSSFSQLREILMKMMSDGE